MSCRILRFGAFELDVDARALRKNGMKVRLGGQPLQILLLLLEKPGDVVTAEELRQKLWPADADVDFDVGLSTAVRKLRDALHDSARNPRFIETLPRRGYRFIAPVVTSEHVPVVEPRRFPRIAVGVAFTGIIAIALVVWHILATLPIRSIAVLPFENLTGDPSQERFVRAMTDTLTTNLGHVKGLRVIARSSDVDAIVEGSVSRAGESLQVSARLMRASTDQLIWARRYQGAARDAAALQRQITRGVVDAIRAANHSSTE
ncbi:MAG TPA: winged helix-turn-helix domain-containing protein [Thermoanaerobaculia bacterium]|nr:winged helix-turn-helix domain-containing protein [Thermoanaerobaculia bacterium]